MEPPPLCQLPGLGAGGSPVIGRANMKLQWFTTALLSQLRRDRDLLFAN